jgi:hypothetical protein
MEHSMLILILMDSVIRSMAIDQMLVRCSGVIVGLTDSAARMTTPMGFRMLATPSKEIH